MSTILTTNQLANLEETKNDMLNKSLTLHSAIDTQVVLQLLVAKGIVTREEVQSTRETVADSPKYKNATIFLTSALEEIAKFEADPKLLLKTMFDKKLNNEK